MTKNKKARQTYYQSIARYLFELRGSPFFLSPREMETVEKWEATAIPLEVILDGIKLAYESFRKKPGRRNKLTLVFCERHVLQAYDLYQERRVGSQRKVFNQEEKQRRLQQAVSAFTGKIPDEVSILQDLFLRIEDELALGKWDEDRLEEYDRQVEHLLMSLISVPEKKASTEELRAEHDLQDPEELERLVRIKLIKKFRDRYEIPHLSLYYY
jgi:hypothetical protein